MVREEGRGQDKVFAMVNLGVLYAKGQGVAQDFAKARERYEKAAAKDEASAMNNLGRLYPTVMASRRTSPRRASGTRRPRPKAWARDENLGLLYHNGLGVRRTLPRRASGSKRPRRKTMRAL